MELELVAQTHGALHGPRELCIGDELCRKTRGAGGLHLLAHQIEFLVSFGVHVVVSPDESALDPFRPSDLLDALDGSLVRTRVDGRPFETERLDQVPVLDAMAGG